MATKITHSQPTPILAASKSVAPPAKAAALHANVLQQLTGWVTSWFVKESLFQKAVKSGSLTITTAHGSILLEYHEDFGRYSLGIVDEYGKIILIHAKNQISLQREALPYLEKIERQNGLIAQATQRDVSALRHSLEDAGLIEEERGVITFKDGGALIKFTGDDRDEKLALYLRWAMPEEVKPSTFERAMMGVVGLTMLGSVIAPAFEAISRLQAQFSLDNETISRLRAQFSPNNETISRLRAHFSPDNETISRLRSHLSPHNLECTAGLVVSGLCIASGQNKELCVALPMLSCLGKAFAEITVVHPIPDQMAYPSKDFALVFNTTSIFRESDPSLPLSFSATQTDGSALPSWLALKMEPSIIGSYSIAKAVSMDVIDKTAYITNSQSGLVIISLADRAHPSFLGLFSTTNGAGVYVLDNKAYLANTITGLQVISVANPAKPTLLGTVITYSNALDLFVTGDRAYIADDLAGLKIISVANPAKPTLLGTFSSPYNSAYAYANGVYVLGNIVYMTDFQSLKIISLETVSQPTLLGTYSTSWAEAVYVVDNIAYLATANGLLTISVANPSHPTLLGSLDLVGVGYKLCVIGNIAYVEDSVYLEIVSVADPTKPTLLSNIYSAAPLFILGDKAYTGDNTYALQIISIANPAQPSFLGSFSTKSLVKSVYVVGTIAYVGEYYYLEIISVANPASPSRLGILSISSIATGVYVINNIAYISANEGGLQIVSVTNPAQPTIISTIAHADELQYVYALGEIAYTVGATGLQVISVANPAQLTLLGSLQTCSATDVVVANDIAYMTAGSEGLKIISVKTPSQPSLLGSLITQNAQSIYVVDDIAYVADGGGGLKIISVTNPAQPSLLGSLKTGAALSIQVVRSKAYIADGAGGIKIISVVNPSQPSIMGTLSTVHSYNDLYVVEPTIYVIDATNGLQVVDCSTWQFAGTTPLSEFGKIYDITLTAENSIGEKASTHFLLKVYNEGPHVASPIPNQTVHIDNIFDFTVPSGTFVDPYGDVLKYTSTLVGGAILPNWLTFNSATHEFKGTPLDESDVHDWAIEVKVEDPYKKSAATDFTLSVLHLGPVLVHGLSDQVVHVRHPFDLPVPSDTFSDLDGLHLTYLSDLVGGNPLPAWLKFNNTSQRFSGTPIARDDIAVWPVEVKAIDPYGESAVTDFTLSVLHLGPIVVNGLKDQTIHVRHPFDFAVPSDTFNDLDGISLTYLSDLVGGNPLPTWLKFNNTSQRFSGTPIARDDIAVWPVEVKAVDPYGKSAATDFTLSVLNLGPVVVHGLKDQTVHIIHPFEFAVPSDTFTDLDELSLTYFSDLVGGKPLPAWLKFNSTAQRFSGTPAARNDVAAWPVEVKAIDPYGKSAATDFTLSVLNLGPAVAHKIANQTLEVGRPLAFTVPENTFLNQEGTILIYSALQANNQTLPLWLHFNTTARAFSGVTQDKTDIKDWTLAVRVDDPYGKYAETTFDLDVYKRGIKVDGTIPQQQIFAKVPFTYTFSEDLFTDQDGFDLKYRALLFSGNPLPAWINFNADTRTFSGKAPDNALGAHQIRLYASDHYGDAHVDFEILVYPFNYQPPTPNKGIPSQRAFVGRLFTLSVPSDAFTNSSKGKLTYNAFLTGGKPLPNWLSFDQTTHTFKGAPRSEEVLSITVTVTDSYNSSAETSFSLTTINETLQTFKTILAIGGPTISALGAMITVYANKANLRNWWKKKKYQLPDKTIQIGKQFTHKITKASARKVGEIRVFKREKRAWKESSTGEYLSSWWNDAWEELPAKQLLPIWLEYHYSNNELRTIPQTMTESDIGDYKVRICDKDKYRLEEFILHLQGAAPALEEAPPRAASSAESSGAEASAELQDPVQGDMRVPLLRDEENVT